MPIVRATTENPRSDRPASKASRRVHANRSAVSENNSVTATMPASIAPPPPAVKMPCSTSYRKSMPNRYSPAEPAQTSQKCAAGRLVRRQTSASRQASPSQASASGKAFSNS